MTADAKAAIPAVDIQRTLDAPVLKVWSAWGGSDAIKAWFGPPGCQVTNSDFEPKAKKAFKVTMSTPDYGEMTAVGSFLEVVPEKRLKMTWNWEGDPEDRKTTLTVDFAEADGKTEIHLHHEGFAEKESRDHHEDGWSGTLDRLEGVVS